MSGIIINPYVYAATGLDQLDNDYYMEFDGTDDYIDCGTGFNSSLELGDSFSYSAWVYFTADGTNRSIIDNNTARPTGVQLRITTAEKARMLLMYKPAHYLYVDSSALAASTWHHIVATYNGSGDVNGINMYINGVLDNDTPTTVGTTSSITSTNNLKIGSENSRFYFNGNIDEVAIFDYELIPADITEIYNATDIAGKKCADLSSMTTPPVAWYRMGD